MTSLVAFDAALREASLDLMAALTALVAIGILCALRRKPLKADWKGKLERRFRLRTLRREWGRWCYQTDATGATLARRFEWCHSEIRDGK